MVTTILMLVNFFQIYEGGRRGHSKKLYERHSRLDTRKYVFANMITDLWNSLPDACVNSITLNQFKSHISKILEREVGTQSVVGLYGFTACACYCHHCHSTLVASVIR